MNTRLEIAVKMLHGLIIANGIHRDHLNKKAIELADSLIKLEEKTRKTKLEDTKIEYDHECDHCGKEFFNLYPESYCCKSCANTVFEQHKK